MNFAEKIRENETVLLRITEILIEERNTHNHNNITVILNEVAEKGISIFNTYSKLSKEQQTLFEIAIDRYKVLFGEIKIY